MHRVWSRVAVAGTGIVIGAGLLAATLRGTPLSALVAVLKAGNWGAPTIVALAGTIGFVLAKTVRWRLLLGGAAEFPIRELVRPVLVGLALNSLVPHSGELFRAIAVQRSHDRAPFHVLSSIFVERLFDLFAVLLLGAAAFWAVPGRGGGLAGAFRMVAVIAAVGAAAVLVALLVPQAIRRLLVGASRLLPPSWQARLVGAADELMDGLAPVRRPTIAIWVLAWSVAQWLCIALCVAGCAGVARFAIDAPAALVVVVGLVVAFLLPNAPGYLGAAQAAFLVALKPFGVTSESALAASLVYELLMILPIAMAGLVLFRAAWRPASAP